MNFASFYKRAVSETHFFLREDIKKQLYCFLLYQVFLGNQYNCGSCKDMLLWNQPILLIFFSFSSSMILIFRPSMIISFSAAKFDSVRMALEVVMLERLAKSSLER